MKPATRLLVFSLIVLILALPAAAGAAGPIPLSPAGVDARRPVVAVTAAGVTHVVWEQEGSIWRRFLKDGVWSEAERIGSGEAPALAAAGPGDGLAAAWSQLFDGNYEVFARRWDGAAWSDEQNVSSNDGGSSAPTLAAAADGAVHLIWSDTSPGAATLYHAISGDGLSWPTAEPIPAALGTQPSAAFAPDGRLVVAWQHRPSFAERLRIWSASWAGSWSAPAAVTDGSAQALAPRLAVGSQQAALAWQEGDQARLAAANGPGWTPLAAVAGQQPALAVTGTGDLFWGWEAGAMLNAQFQAGSWSPAFMLASAGRTLDLAPAGPPAANVIHQAWAAQTGGNWRVLYDATILGRVYLPAQRR